MFHLCVCVLKNKTPKNNAFFALSKSKNVMFWCLQIKLTRQTGGERRHLTNMNNMERAIEILIELGVDADDAQEQIVSGNLHFVPEAGMRIRDNSLLEELVRSCGDSLIEANFADFGVGDRFIRTLARWCPNLRSIDIGVDADDGGNVNVTDESIIALAESCPDLSLVRIDGCRRLTDKSVIALATYCPGLEVFSVVECLGISDKGMCVLAESCQGLKAVNILFCFHIGDPTIVIFKKYCPYLAEINTPFSGLTAIGIRLAKEICDRPKPPPLKDFWWVSKVPMVSLKGQMN